MQTVEIDKSGGPYGIEFNPPLIVYYRPGTTDEKVIDEVLKRNVYQKKSVDFAIEPQDVWLNLGTNISNSLY